MIGQILPNNNEKCYKNFSQKFLASKQALNAIGAHSTGGRTDVLTNSHRHGMAAPPEKVDVGSPVLSWQSRGFGRPRPPNDEMTIDEER
jgi:hypothetical protein